MLSKTAFYIVYIVGMVWFVAAAVYTYRSAIKDFIELKINSDKQN